MNLLRIHLIIALRNIIRSPRRSGLTIGAIAFGLFCLIVFQALKDGLHKEMVSSSLALDTGAVQIHAGGYESNLALTRNIPDLASVKAALARTSLSSYTMRIKAPALILAGVGSSSVLLTGIMPEREQRVSFIARRIVAGAYLKEKDLSSRDIIMGQALADSLGLAIGDQVNLMAQGAFAKPVLGRFTLKGVYRTSLTSFDRFHVYLPLTAAQNFLQAQGVISEIVIRTDENAARHYARTLAGLLPGPTYQVRSWQEVLPDLQQLIELNDATMNLLIIIVFAIVSLGIANTMTTVIFERFREIGTLAAMGATPAGIVGLIGLESLCLGAIAALIGGITGLAACHYFHIYGIDLSHFISDNHYFADGYLLRAELSISDLFGAVAITLGTALLAGIYPACKAAGLEPVKAITHN